MWTLRVLLFLWYSVIFCWAVNYKVENKSTSVEWGLLVSWSWCQVRSHALHDRMWNKEVKGKLWVRVENTIEAGGMIQFWYPMRDSKKWNETTTYLHSWGWTLTLMRGYRGRLDKLSRGVEAKTYTSDHKNHHQCCQRHNNMRDQLPGEGSMSGWPLLSYLQ